MGGRVLIQITPQMRILVAIESIDGRKGIDSLAQLCRERLDADPFSGCLFIFRSRSGKSIRILAYDSQGFWLATKRLSKGRFRWWPTGAVPASAPGADAPGGRQSGDRSRAGVAEREFMKKDLRSGFSSGKLIARCQPSGDTGAELLQRKTFCLFARSSPRIRMRADADYRRSCAKLGNGSKPTARRAT